MTKEEAKNKLKKLGYVVGEDNSIVTVLISPGTSMKNTIKAIKDALYDMGYNSSFAVRQHKGSEALKSTEDNDEDIELEVETTEEETFEEESDLNVITDVAKAANKENLSAKKEAINSKESDDSNDDEDDDEYYDEEDSDMLLTEDSIQFSLEDFGLDF